MEVVDLTTVTTLNAGTAQSNIPTPATSSDATTPISAAMTQLVPLLGGTTGRFTYQYIPELINAIGNLANGPWCLYGLNYPGLMSDIARKVWPELTITVAPREPFYELVSHVKSESNLLHVCLMSKLPQSKQKASDYRTAVGNEAMSAVTSYMRREFQTSQERVEWIQWALSGKFPFRYEKAEIVDGKEVRRMHFSLICAPIRTVPPHD